MPIFKDLDEQFNAKIEKLYGEQRPYKESGELHPIITYRPDDPNRPQGPSEANRLVPVARTTRDISRLTQYLLSPSGLQFILNQELLQTGNAISETRIIDPTWLIKNAAPYTHAKRQIFDQTEIVIRNPERSPASTPLIGAAGRLQKSTGEEALAHVFGENSMGSILGVISSTQIAQTLSSVFNFFEGTYGINERPELQVPFGSNVAGVGVTTGTTIPIPVPIVGGSRGQTNMYSVVLYGGRKAMYDRYAAGLITALGIVGTGLSYVGLPNIFSDIGPVTGQGPTRGYADIMPYFVSGINERNNDATIGPVTYVRASNTGLNKQIRFGPLRLSTSNILSTLFQNLLGIDLSPIVSQIPRTFRNAFGPEIFLDDISDFGTMEGRIISAPGPLGVAFEPGLLNLPKRTIRYRYTAPETPTEETGLTKAGQEDFIRQKKAIDDSIEAYQNDYKSFREQVAKGKLSSRGIYGGLTPDNIDRVTEASSYEQAVQVMRQNYKEGRPSYYRDELNEKVFVSGIEGAQFPVNLQGGLIEGVPTVPQDFVNVTFLDVVNNRLMPFRAFLAGISETVSPEYSEDRYIGRIERLIVYTGAVRTLNFTLYVNAFSERELDPIWQKVNYLTGLCFPSKYTGDGFMAPPLVRLTIGNLYTNQPGYISSLTHTVEDDVPWEINPDNQVPHQVQMAISYNVIEKEAMKTGDQFYGFGNPRT